MLSKALTEKALTEYVRKGYFDEDADHDYIVAVHLSGYTLKRVKSRGIVYVIEWEGGFR